MFSFLNSILGFNINGHGGPVELFGYRTCPIALKRTNSFYSVAIAIKAKGLGIRGTFPESGLTIQTIFRENPYEMPYGPSRNDAYAENADNCGERRRPVFIGQIRIFIICKFASRKHCGPSFGRNPFASSERAICYGGFIFFFLSAVKLASGEFRRRGRAMEFGGGGEGEEGRRTDDDAWEERTDGGRRILFISESPTLGIPAGR